MLRWLTAGESHGSALAGIIEGIPSGLRLEVEHINRYLARRQKGYGRGARMSIERDSVEILSGVRHGMTLGSPIALIVRNLDWENWREKMSPSPIFGSGNCSKGDCSISRPRPGHADLAGSLKYNQPDIRNILERSSARSTAVSVALGSVAGRLLDELQIAVAAHVISIGGIYAEDGIDPWLYEEAISNSCLFCADAAAEGAMIEEIDLARRKGDTLGGIFELRVRGLYPGIGSHVQADRRLDAQLAQAIMGIPAVKGVEAGQGFAVAGQPGSKVHDPIKYDSVHHVYTHTSNNAGGIEGGMSNGEDLILRAAMKPIPTLMQPLESVDMNDKSSVSAHAERADVCAVPAASVVAQAEVCLVIARALLEKHGGDSMAELQANYNAYKQMISKR
ncbi:MAG: chorismate synthase [bacterium]|jgi:chorismate synthase